MTLGDLALALGLGEGRGAKALARTLSRARAAQRTVALSDPIARALELEGHHPTRTSFRDGRLELEDGTAEALCGSGLPALLGGSDIAAALRTMAECIRVVKDGGQVLVATPRGLGGRGPERPHITALFFHAGLVDLEQHTSGRTIVTSGRVRR
jgi:hypothetical protein